MKNNNIMEWVGNGIAVVFTAIQDNQIFQIISFILTSLSVCLTIAFTIYKWYNKAKEDGQITPDEIQDLVDDLDDIKNKQGKEKKDD